jgi:hypothetical protein
MQLNKSSFSVLDFNDEDRDNRGTFNPKRKAIKMLRQIYNLQQKLENGEILISEEIEKIKTRYKWEKILDPNFKEPTFQTKKQKEQDENKKIKKMKEKEKKEKRKFESFKKENKKREEQFERNIRWQKRYDQQKEEKRYRHQQEEEEEYRQQQEEGGQYRQILQVQKKTQLEIDVETEYNGQIAKSNSITPEKDAWRKMQLKYSTDKNVNHSDPKKLTEIVQILNNLYGK